MTRLSLAAVLAASTAIAACGSSGSNNSGTADDKRGLQFAQCMREHGVDMPDPTPGNGGAVEFHSVGGPGKAGKGSGPAPGTVDKAMLACRKYAPNGGQPPSAAQQQEMLDSALKFSRCMRAHGVDMPDPKLASGGNGIMIGGPGSAKLNFDPTSPRFKAAQEACKSAMPKPPGGKGGAGFSTSSAGAP